MARVQQAMVPSEPLERFAPVLGEAAVRAGRQVAKELAARLAGRVIWNVNSTAVGGGVAEMLRPLVGYARGAGLDARWLVIQGEPEFFRITKRLHNALHGVQGDGSPIGERERGVYEATLRANARELDAMVRPGDVVLLHDPQTAGLAPHLVRSGLRVIWRCHIGDDAASDEAAAAWNFLAPYLEPVSDFVFSRATYVPEICDHGKAHIIAPSIDAFSAKNQDLSAQAVHAILVHTGLVEGPPPAGDPTFVRNDGTPARVERCVDVVRQGRAPAHAVPLVVQVSRWDRLKDPVGVMVGFGQIDPRAIGEAELVLAGPNVWAVADDPEADEVFGEVLAAWRSLPHAVRNRIAIVSLPTADVQENAAIVNALQRHASVIVQKSLREGFGLTVTEGMWKGRPVVASGVGGIQDQIENDVNGLLLANPESPDELAAALVRVLGDGALASRLGNAARETVRERYLGIRHLIDYARLIEQVDER